MVLSSGCRLCLILIVGFDAYGFDKSSSVLFERNANFMAVCEKRAFN